MRKHGDTDLSDIDCRSICLNLARLITIAIFWIYYNVNRLQDLAAPAVQYGEHILAWELRLGKWSKAAVRVIGSSACLVARRWLKATSSDNRRSVIESLWEKMYYNANSSCVRISKLSVIWKGARDAVYDESRDTCFTLGQVARFPEDELGKCMPGPNDLKVQQFIAAGITCTHTLSLTKITGATLKMKQRRAPEIFMIYSRSGRLRCPVSLRREAFHRDSR